MGSRHPGIQPYEVQAEAGEAATIYYFPCCCGAAGREAAVTDRARWQSRDIERGRRNIQRTALEKDLETLEVTSSFGARFVL